MGDDYATSDEKRGSHTQASSTAGEKEVVPLDYAGADPKNPPRSLFAKVVGIGMVLYLILALLFFAFVAFLALNFVA